MDNGIYLKDMGKKIRAIRNSQKITLRQLGAMCNLHHGAISEIENGQRNSYLHTLKSIADVLKVDVKDFL